jgi:excisionase family DNA binding protein
MEIISESKGNVTATADGKLIPACAAAKYIGVSRNTFSAMVNSNQITYRQINKRKKFKKTELDKFVK